MGARGPKKKLTQEKFREICNMMAEGRTLTAILKSTGIVSRPAFYGWLWSQPQETLNMYERAREALADAWGDSIIEIADDGSNDTYIDDDGDTRTNWDVVNRSKLRVDTRKWLMSKLNRKRYGDQGEADNTTQRKPEQITIVIADKPKD